MAGGEGRRVKRNGIRWFGALSLESAEFLGVYNNTKLESKRAKWQGSEMEVLARVELQRFIHSCKSIIHYSERPLLSYPLFFCSPSGGEKRKVRS